MLKYEGGMFVTVAPGRSRNFFLIQNAKKAAMQNIGNFYPISGCVEIYQQAHKLLREDPLQKYLGREKVGEMKIRMCKDL